MSERILCVDDEPNVVEGYRRLLQRDFSIVIATSGSEALELIRNHGPFAVLVSDMRMPVMNGVEFLAKATELSPDSVRVMLTGNADQQTAIDAVNHGQIFRFLTKPCSSENFSSALKASLRQHQLICAEKDLLENTMLTSLQVLTDVFSMANPTAFGRAARVRRLVTQLAKSVNAKYAWQIELAALLSQLGCINVPEELLTRFYEGKQLSPEELKVVNNYPKVGHDLIAKIPRLENVAKMIASQNRFSNPETTVPGIESDDSTGCTILNLALEFDRLIEGRFSSTEAFLSVKRRSNVFGAELIKALGNVLADSETMFELRQLRIHDLTPEMILAKDITAANGFLLVSKGHEVTASIRIRLQTFLARGNIVDSITVFVPRETPSYRRQVDSPEFTLTQPS